MVSLPTLVFVPGSWHKPSCYNKVMEQLQCDHNIKCLTVTLPSTTGDPDATFKNDLDGAKAVISSETTQGRDVVVIAHSYGGMVGASAIKGFSRSHSNPPSSLTSPGHVKALILIASGFAITGLSFMDPLLGIPPPSWRANRTTGFAELATSPRELFYHDLAADEAARCIAELTPQSLKALFEGGEHVYAGWRDVPTWYVGTAEDRALPVVLQRVQVGMARGQGGVVVHEELAAGHSPFLSKPQEVVRIVMEAVREVSGLKAGEGVGLGGAEMRSLVPEPRLGAPWSWVKYGLPLLVGRCMGWAILGFMSFRRFWRRS